MSKLMSRRPRLYTRRLSSRLFVRNLEDRTVPAAFLVNANTDISAGSGFAGDLRFCIEQANALPGPDTITFDPSVTLVGLSGIELVISDSLTIIGNGSGSTTIDALGLSRIFKIDDSVAGSSINVSISGLTLTNGKGLNNAVADRGGAVLVQDEIVSFNDVSFVGNAAAQRGGALALAAFPGKVTVTKSSFVNNFTTGSNSGGAINVVDGQLDISSSTLTGNTASLRGGAIYQTGPSSIVTIGNSTISNNRNTSLGGGALTVLNGTLTISDSAVSGNTSSGRGGAVYALANGSVDVVRSTFSGNRAEGASTQNGGAISGQSAARVTILESTLSGNTALGRGGAVYTNRTLTVIDRSTILNNSAGTLGGGVCMIPFSINAVSEIRNSTFTGNIAQTNGGGIALYITYGITRIQNCTIVGNTANGSGGGLSRTGFGPSRLLLDSNIIANNTNANAPDFNGGGNTAANSVLANNNLIFSPTGNGVITGTGNIFSVDPDLGPLQNNGGLTQTFKPNPTSPVINAGLNPTSAARASPASRARALISAPSKSRCPPRRRR